MTYPYVYAYNTATKEWIILGHVLHVSRGPRRVFVMGEEVRSKGTNKNKSQKIGSYNNEYKWNFDGPAWQVYEGITIEDLIEKHFVELL